MVNEEDMPDVECTGILAVDCIVERLVDVLR